MNTNTVEIIIEDDAWDGDTDIDLRTRQREVANAHLRDAALQALRQEIERLTQECATLRAERDLLLLSRKKRQ